MKVIDLLDYTECQNVVISQNGGTLFTGKVENSPYKYIRKEVLAFGFKADLPDGNLVISI